MNPPLDPRGVRRSFSAAAGSYGEANVVQREVAGRLAERLELLRVEPQRVLDLGCGPGDDARRLADAFPRAELIAIDAALGLLARATPRIGWRRRPVRRVCGDACALPLPDRSIGLVWSNLALQWVDPPNPALEEVARVLRPDGVFLFSSFGPDTLTELRQAWAAVDDRPHVNRFIDMHDLGDDLLRAGFREPVMDMERLTVTYADVRALMRELKALGAHNVARDRHRGLTGRGRMTAMIDAYRSRFESEGRIPATWELLYGIAWAPAPGQARADAGGSVATVPLDALRGSRVRRDEE